MTERITLLFGLLQQAMASPAATAGGGLAATVVIGIMILIALTVIARLA